MANAGNSVHQWNGHVLAEMHIIIKNTKKDHLTVVFFNALPRN
jgi:hypothetical protein